MADYLTVPITLDISSLSALEETAQKIASLLRPGDWLFLSGELGSGKTTFMQSLSTTLGVAQGTVQSPTFTLLNAYNAAQSLPGKTRGTIQKILHLDLYRLTDGSELCYIGIEEEWQKDRSICCIEWPEQVSTEEWIFFFKTTGCTRPLRLFSLSLTYNPATQRRVAILQLEKEKF